VEEFREHLLPDLERWLRQLARYGDRVSVRLVERWRDAIRLDSPVFDLVLEPGGD
jgi:hypothetical protein